MDRDNELTFLHESRYVPFIALCVYLGNNEAFVYVTILCFRLNVMVKYRVCSY